MAPKRLLALFMVLLILGLSTGLATPYDTVETLTADILYAMQYNFFPAPVSAMWKRHFTAAGVFTEAEWEQACTAAISQAKLMGIWDYSWEDDPTVLRGDLGDASVPTYVLCGMALLAVAGMIVARKKRMSAC